VCTSAVPREEIFCIETAEELQRRLCKYLCFYSSREGLQQGSLGSLPQYCVVTDGMSRTHLFQDCQGKAIYHKRQFRSQR